MHNVLILGCNGFIGQYLTSELMRRGIRVVGYDRVGAVFAAPDRFIEGNFCCESDFSHIIEEENIDTVFHLISTTTPAEGVVNVMREVEENILPTMRLLEALKGRGVQVIFPSSGGTVYGETENSANKTDDALRPICSYGMQKLAIENFMRLYDATGAVRCKICRVSNPYGVMPQQGRTQGIIPILLRRLFDDEPITLFGDTVRDYIYITDVIEALIKVAEYQRSLVEFNVGSGIGVSLNELVEKLEQAAGKRFKQINRLPIRSCDVRYSVLDCANTEKELGWSRQVSLDAGICHTISHMKELL